jgi:hypothetical protein
MSSSERTFISVFRKAASSKNPNTIQKGGTEMKHTDQFVLSVISLAFALKKLLESDYYDESKYKLVQDFTRLKNRVQLHTKILENKETAKNFREKQISLT